jgi:hypothetical protein
MVFHVHIIVHLIVEFTVPLKHQNDSQLVYYSCSLVFRILPQILWRNGTRSWPDPPSLFPFMKLVWNLCSILVLRMRLILRFLAAGFSCDFSLLNFDIYYLRKLTRTHVAFQGWRLAPSKQCNKLGTWWQPNQLLNKFTWKSKIYVSQIIHLCHKTFSVIFVWQLCLKVSTFWHTSMNTVF